MCSRTILHAYIFPLGKLLHLVMLHNRSYHRMVENVGCLLREKKKKEKKIADSLYSTNTVLVEKWNSIHTIKVF